MSESEERALARWVSDMSKNGFSVRKPIVVAMAEEMRKQRVASINDASMELVSYPSIGSEWIDRFITRFPNLKAAFARQIDQARMRETTEEVINRWFNTFVETLREYNLKQHNIYNMDETGFAIGTTQATCVLINAEI